MLYHDRGALRPLEHLSCEKSPIWMSSDAMFELLLNTGETVPLCVFVQLDAFWSA